MRSSVADKKPAAEPGKPSALDEAKARFDAIRKQAEERKAVAAAKAPATEPAAAPTPTPPTDPASKP